jgi:hypothetical protein
MVMSKEQFETAYNQASVAVTGQKASSALITEGYEVLKDFAKFMAAPNAVPIFTGTVSEKDGKLDWGIDSNRDGRLSPTRGYFDPKKDGSANLTL